MFVSTQIAGMFEMKRCTACGDEKPHDQFHKDKSQIDGLMCQCKPCRSILRRLSYERTKEKRLAYQQAYRAKIFADPIAKREYYWIKNLKRKYHRENRT